MMRLLWARSLDYYRTAIVIDNGMGQLIGGVVQLRNFSINIPVFTRSPNTLEMNFLWEWWRVVDSPEEFADKREWEGRELAKPLVQLDPPTSFEAL